MNDPGICCPECGSGDNAVTDTRPWRAFIKRRRRCGCGHAWSTAEVPMAIFHDYPRIIREMRYLRDQMTLVLAEAEDLKLPDVTDIKSRAA
jgi:transcriptional regulator NrdR family protein